MSSPTHTDATHPTNPCAPPLAPPAQAVIVDHPKYRNNLALIVRTADVYAVPQVIVSNPTRVQRPGKPDTANAWARIGSHAPSLADALRRFPDATVVGIEMDAAAIPLPNFQHPTNAVYVLGSEDLGLSAEDRARCDVLIQVPSARSWSLNVEQSLVAVLYDRYVKGIPAEG